MEDPIIISSSDCIKELEKINLLDFEKINIIFNNFQKSSLLNDISLPESYIYRSISSTSAILEYIKIKKIKVNRILYTSSGSVYGDNVFCKETDITNPVNLHSSLKISNEKLIKMFCEENHIDYIIARVFNMYGANDTFSVISRLHNSYKSNNIFNIINEGSSIRDFVHINDVVKIYKILLGNKNVGVINIGTGFGVSIKNILNFLKINKININTNNVKRDEISVSTADISKLREFIINYQFESINDYIIKELT